MIQGSAGSATELGNLFFVIEKLINLHRHLRDVLEEEYAHMIAVDIVGLAEIAKTKEILVSEIYNHEKLRIKAVNDIALKLDIKTAGSHPLTLLEISDRLADPEAQKLKGSREVLNMLVSRAKESNGRNMIFAKKSLDRIEVMKKNVLGENNNNVKENYSVNGTRQTMGEHGGRLLSTEA